jgi:DNA-binding transcriptional ArsR family regulator
MSSYSLTVKATSENEPEIKIDLLGVKKSALILRAINHKLRQVMLKLIDENDKITVTEIYTHLRLEQSVASQHLAILRKAGFVKTKRNGKFIYYSVNRERMLELNKFVKNFLT